LDDPSGETTFVYTIYIKASPNEWQGLTDPALSKHCWRHGMAGFDLRSG
jgi:hypothetical protein